MDLLALNKLNHLLGTLASHTFYIESLTMQRTGFIALHGHCMSLHYMCIV